MTNSATATPVTNKPTTVKSAAKASPKAQTKSRPKAVVGTDLQLAEILALLDPEQQRRELNRIDSLCFDLEGIYRRAQASDRLLDEIVTRLKKREIAERQNFIRQNGHAINVDSDSQPEALRPLDVQALTDQLLTIKSCNSEVVCDIEFLDEELGDLETSIRYVRSVQEKFTALRERNTCKS